MKKIALEFVRRGVASAGIGPIVLAIIYLIMQKAAGIDSLTVNQVCVGIFSITTLAFIAGGMNAIYQIERLPLMAAILIHGAVLYIGYLATYLINDWLDFGVLPVIVFSVIFVVGYIVICTIVYSIVRKNTDKLNKMLDQRSA